MVRHEEAGADSDSNASGRFGSGRFGSSRFGSARLDSAEFEGIAEVEEDPEAALAAEESLRTEAEISTGKARERAPEVCPCKGL